MSKQFLLWDWTKLWNKGEWIIVNMFLVSLASAVVESIMGPRLVLVDKVRSLLILDSFASSWLIHDGLGWLLLILFDVGWSEFILFDLGLSRFILVISVDPGWSWII